jgi:hypothetical protein
MPRVCVCMSRMAVSSLHAALWFECATPLPHACSESRTRS